MHILYLALKYDYGRPERGYSFEHCNFHDPLCRLGHEVLHFDFIALAQEYGRKWMNRRLLEIVRSDRPDLMFTVLALEYDQLDKAVVRQISDDSGTLTANWFCDDHYRFENYSRYWAPCFNWVITTDENALPKYTRIGHGQVIHTQWACNHFLYRKLDLPLKYDVTFVGSCFGNRRAIVQALRSAGIHVGVWGSGWDSSRLSQEEMIGVFNQSRINLNFAEAACPTSVPEGRIKSFLRRVISPSLQVVPFGAEVKKAGKRWLSKSQPVTPQAFPKQIKGRNFEVPGCGSLLLTESVANLEKYYDPKKEIVCFGNTHDLIDKVKYYLRREEEAREIARAGYERTLREHTYTQRFSELFLKMGLSSSLPLRSCDAELYDNFPRQS